MKPCSTGGWICKVARAPGGAITHVNASYCPGAHQDTGPHLAYALSTVNHREKRYALHCACRLCKAKRDRRKWRMRHPRQAPHWRPCLVALIAPKSIRWSNEAARTAGIGYRGHDDAANCSSPFFLPASSSIDLGPASRQARQRARAVLSGESAASERRRLAYPGTRQGVDTSRHLVSTLEYQFRCPPLSVSSGLPVCRYRTLPALGFAGSQTVHLSYPTANENNKFSVQIVRWAEFLMHAHGKKRSACDKSGSGRGGSPAQGTANRTHRYVLRCKTSSFQ